MIDSLLIAVHAFVSRMSMSLTECMCYNQTGDISTLDGTPLKLIDKFTYLGSSISSTEKDINTTLLVLACNIWNLFNSVEMNG